MQVICSQKQLVYVQEKMLISHLGELFEIILISKLKFQNNIQNIVSILGKESSFL